jgi:dTDP-4-dehydrorhamnose reductase
MMPRARKLAIQGPTLLLGASGLLGASLLPVLEEAGGVVSTQGRSAGVQHRADFARTNEAAAVLDAVRPGAIVNLIGATNVDRCEQQPDEAYRTNSRVVENVAAWMRQRSPETHLVHVSTDQLYDGDGPQSEDGVTIRNTYALSKYCGELAAVGVASTILRTNFFGRSRCAKRQSFTDWLYGSLTRGDHIRVFDDVRFSPLSMASLSNLICAVIGDRILGVFNLGSRDGMSKADFAFEFAAALGLSTRSMSRVPIAGGLPLTAYRPRDMRMDVSKIEAALGIRLPTLAAEIRRTAEEYDERA